MMKPRLKPRRTLRDTRRQAALITFGGNATPIACVVWDISKGGARLTAAHASALPDVFMLVLGQGETAQHHCRVVWKKKPYLGVQFVSAEEAEQFARPVARPVARQQTNNGVHWLNRSASIPRDHHHKAMRNRKLFDF